MQDREVLSYLGTMTTGTPHSDNAGLTTLPSLILLTSLSTISRFMGPARCGCDRAVREPGTRSTRCGLLQWYRRPRLSTLCHASSSSVVPLPLLRGRGWVRLASAIAFKFS